MATVKELLKSRETELMESISRVYLSVAPMETELADVRRAMAAIGMDVSAEPPRRARGVDEFDPAPEVDPNPYRRRSMKELAVMALEGRYRPTGATAKELLEFFHSEYGRTDITRESLSPQLSRLKSDGIVDRSGTTWFLPGRLGDLVPSASRLLSSLAAAAAGLRDVRESGDGGQVPGQTLEARPWGSNPPVSTSVSTGEEGATPSPNESQDDDLFVGPARPSVPTEPTR